MKLGIAQARDNLYKGKAETAPAREISEPEGAYPGQEYMLRIDVS